MKLYTACLKGDFHNDHNEDAIFTGQIGESIMVFAIMDGCSSGKESHFASSLIAKILNKGCYQIDSRIYRTKEKITTSECKYELMKSLFFDLKEIKARLFLNTEELLSTIILGVLNLEDNTCEILTVGDGVIFYDGQMIEYDQGDKPDYLGYHLSEEFEGWYSALSQQISFSFSNDLCISSDGIFTFKKIDNEEYPKLDEKSIRSILFSDKLIGNEEMGLIKAIRRIELEFGLRPSDDISIIRILK